MSKSGFSTLHRWLGRKNKDKSAVNGKLSKSNTNLSISSTNINETSQLEYNRITPLPAATTNAPFEQTFRITVLLPKDQLYVTRLGARVPLSKLLELVCDNKLLDAEKYEFRNPVDSSQVYSCDLTIGAVGLCEIRLCHKSESYDNFNSDEIIKLHRTSLIRESLSSSEFSSRNSKHTTKTTSPYSSTNSLNSMDSTALSYGRMPKVPLSSPNKVAAPPRKKRAAPRPPSQKAIPEKSTLIIENGHEEQQQPHETSNETPLTTKDFSVSTPNLSSSTLVLSDINGNDCNAHIDDFNELSSGNGSFNSNGYAEDTVLYAQVQKKNALNLCSQSKDDVDVRENGSNLPEPSPRKRIVQTKKKSTAPPAPPPRSSLYQDDAVSIASTNVSSTSATTTPVDSSKTLDDCLEQNKKDADVLTKEDNHTNDNLPTPLPRLTTSTTLLNATDIEQDLKNFESETEVAKAKINSNVSKVLLNRTPTPEPRSLSCEPPEIENSFEAQLEHFKQQGKEDDSVSKQADSGIGEPVPSPIPDSLNSAINNLDVKVNFESSSDDDDLVKVYNFKLGKTLVKPVSETKTLEELTVLNNGREETDSEISTSLTITPLMPTSNALTETSSWNFSIPISPPPTFADKQVADNFGVETEMEAKPDAPITPKIMERPVLDFEELKREQEQQELKEKNEKQHVKLSRTPSTPLDNILDELSTIIQEKGLDSLIKKTENAQEIESAKPNTLSNFTINSIQQTNTNKHKEVLSRKCSTETESKKSAQEPKETYTSNIETSLAVCTEKCYTEPDFVKSSQPLSSPSSASDEEKLYRKRNSVSSLKQRRSITRSDSFHATAGHNESLSLNKCASSSQLSLDQMAGYLNRRKSSSELSIAESPSLQSLEVIKTILNSRKNSLTPSSGEDERDTEINARRPSNELKFASLELKTIKSGNKNGEKLANETELEGKQEIMKKEVKTQNETIEKNNKELPKVYRYSGPPSINFTTWSERPKSQVAIKNEGDYIFGGGKVSVQNNNYRMSTPMQSTKQPPAVAAKPATIQRMGIPEKDYKVPVLVKPIQDVIVDNATQKEEVKNAYTSSNRLRMNGESSCRRQSQNFSKTPVVETFSTQNTLPRPALRPTIESVLRPQTQTIVNTSTLPRSNKQRFSTPDVVEKHQILRSSSIKQQNETEKVLTIPGPQILQASFIQQKPGTEKCSTLNTETPMAPFGQSTLRRTGLKEKILAKEEQETQKVINEMNVATPSSPPIPSKQLSNGELKLNNHKNSNTTSAKLHLSLKRATTSPVTISTSNQNSKTVSPSYSSCTFTTALKSRPLTPVTAPVLITHNRFYLNRSSPNSPPPPPPAMNMRLKPVTPVSSPTSSDDPRDELLTAIRNFNKEGLKRA